MLSAFKRSFYGHFGYVPANTSPLVKTSAQSLRSGLDLKIDSELSVERIRAVDAKDLFNDFVHEFCPSRYHGFVLKTDISDAYWKLRNKDAILALIRDRAGVQALARYRIKGVPTEIPGDNEQSVFVHEMYWRSLPARDALLRFFASHFEQVENVTFFLPFGELFEHWFPDAEWSMRMYQAWAVRVVDAENALEGLPAQGTGRVVMDVTDEFCKWNNGTIRLSASDGKLVVEPSGASAEARFSIEGLSALVYGTMPLEEIEYMGWGEVHGSSRQILQRWFPVQPIHNAFEF
jgi:predicted acetyltransferase